MEYEDSSPYFVFNCHCTPKHSTLGFFCNESDRTKIIQFVQEEPKINKPPYRPLIRFGARQALKIIEIGKYDCNEWSICRWSYRDDLGDKISTLWFVWQHGWPHTPSVPEKKDRGILVNVAVPIDVARAMAVHDQLMVENQPTLTIDDWVGVEPSKEIPATHIQLNVSQAFSAIAMTKIKSKDVLVKNIKAAISAAFDAGISKDEILAACQDSRAGRLTE